MKILTPFLLLLTLSSCLTAKKMDKFVAAEYNNQIPKPGKKKSDIVVNAAFPVEEPSVSSTLHKTDKMLPLLFYWKLNTRKTCTLNPAIAYANFSNTVQSSAARSLTQKLAGAPLTLTVEQVPNAFAMVSKESMVWVIYAIAWEKVYVEPDGKDLVVSYKFQPAGGVEKTGRITVKNNLQNKGVRFFQSWKSATSDYLNEYNAAVTAMSREVLKKLQEEL